MTRRPPIQPDDVLAVIREHGPITKSEISIRLINGSCNNPRQMRILDELVQAKRIKLSKGYPKNGKHQIGWVYSVTP